MSVSILGWSLLFRRMKLTNIHFEKIATSLEWPREVWTFLLQRVLVGKAQEKYSALSVEKSAQYDEVKKAILKAYKLVPEAYQQKFRDSRKQDG